MDFMAHFTMGTGGHYITMLPADWSISTSHDTLPSSFCGERCYGIAASANVLCNFITLANIMEIELL